ncbi:MAG: FAD synthetase family protein [Treponema sp.]|nr:FAD synthetase family protein [Treponema sp.]
MKVIEWQQFLKDGLPLGRKFSSLTVGVFDGVHLGHQALVKQVVSYSKNNIPVVITFVENHKKTRRNRNVYPGDIQSFRQKIAMFGNLGVEIIIVVEFTESFKKMSGAEFLQILLDHGKMGFMAVGRDFRCGYRLDTDAPAIKKFYAARNIPAKIVTGIKKGPQPVSSSRIREAISQGKLKEAAAMLGYNYTADFSCRNQVLPPSGKYQVILRKKLQDPGIAAEIKIEKEIIQIPANLTKIHRNFAEFIP